MVHSEHDSSREKEKHNEGDIFDLCSVYFLLNDHVLRNNYSRLIITAGQTIRRDFRISLQSLFRQRSLYAPNYENDDQVVS